MAYQLIRRPTNNKILEFKLISYESKREKATKRTIAKWISNGTHLQIAYGKRLGCRIYAIREAVDKETFITTAPATSIKVEHDRKVIIDAEDGIYTLQLT